jgi:hypothetical protein
MKYTVKHQMRPHEEARSYYTGFLLYEKGATIWVTAGHCMEEIEQVILADNDSYVDVTFRFIDTLHSNAVSELPPPFAYQDEKFKAFLVNRDDQGIELGWDFGVIFLRSHYADLLSGNNIVPISEPNWTNVPEKFDRYYMLGLPGERVKPVEKGIYTARPSMFSISRLDERPECFKTQTDSMFYAKIDPDSDVESIKGMSGGPILGVQFKDGQARYWVLAVQSQWLASDRMVCASPLAELRAILIKLIDTLMDDTEPGE